MLVTMRYGANSTIKPETPGSSWKLLGKTTITTSSTSTTATAVGTISLPASWTKEKIIMVRVRDQAGKRAG